MKTIVEAKKMLLELQRKSNNEYRSFRKALDTSMELAIMLIQLNPKEGTPEGNFLVAMASAIEDYENATIPKAWVKNG